MIKNIKDYKNKRKEYFLLLLTTLMILSVIYFLKICANIKKL